MNPTLGFTLVFLFSTPFILTVTFGPIISKFLAKITPTGINDGDAFDFLVVGSGSAGSVVAGRLVEAGHQVLLIEAGGPPNWMMAIPALMASSQLTDYDWQYKSVEQKYTMKALKGRKANWPRGKVLGGSSQINGMNYVRGHPGDYDMWNDAIGVGPGGGNGWSYMDVLPFFKKSERFFGSKEDIDLQYHGTDGPMGVRTVPDVSDLTLVFEEALAQIGLSPGDHNGEKQEVRCKNQVNSNNGWRADSYSTFAAPYVGKGLTVLTYAQVTKILFKDKQAIGVELQRFDKTLKLYANKEVILSAGSVGSPQLLMLSGIGPKEQLAKVGIQTLVDSPGVGQNLQDHVMGFYPLKVNETMNGGRRLSVGPFAMNNPLNYLEFFTTGRGLLSDNFLRAGAFIVTETNTDKLRRPDIQIHTYPFPASLDFGIGFRHLYGFSDEGYYALYENDDNSDAGVLLPTLLRPKSKGSIILASKDPFDHPIIDPRYFEHPDDIKTMMTGLKALEPMLETEAFKSRGIEHKPIKLCDQHKTFTDAYYKCFCEHYIFTVYHPVGTCKMGAKNDKMAVVDATLRVNGVKNLRVIDASIMPNLVSGNTHAPTVMVGERGADFIIQDYSSSKKSKTGKDEL